MALGTWEPFSSMGFLASYSDLDLSSMCKDSCTEEIWG